MVTVSNIQTGTATVLVNNVTGTATPSSYTAGNSILFFTMEGGGFAADAGFIRAEKTDSTTITFERAARADDYTVDINWVLVEFDTGVSVQDVQFTGNGNQTISTITESKSFIVSLGMFESGARDNSASGRCEITSSTQVTFTADSSGQDSGFQVVQYDDCSVQEVVLTGGRDDDFQATVSSVTEGSSALFVTSEWNDNGTIANYEMFWMWLSSSTTVDGAKNYSGPSFTVTPMFYLVSFTDNTTVERALATITGTNTTTTATLSNKAVDERSVSFLNASCYPYMCGATSSSAQTGETTIRGGFTSTTQLTMYRDDSTALTGDSNISWEVINWDLGGMAFNPLFAFAGLT